MESLFNNWESVVASVRNDIVFEERNKVYGAYYLRRNHNRNMVFSLFISSGFFILLAFSPTIVSWIRNTNVVDVPQTSTQVIIMPPPPVLLKEIELPKITPPEPPVEKLMKSVKLTPFEVKDDVVKDEHVILQTEENPPIGNDTHDGEDGIIDFNHKTGNIIVAPEIEKPVPYVDQMPTFPGGEEAMNKFINDHISFPQMEKELGISGTCYVTFVVEKDGSITDVKIARGVSEGPGYDVEAKHVVKAMPKWKAGKQNGTPVRVQFVLPINFKL
ncbi:MAG: TonB family protein [Crocinitomicaceae bacterium]